mmetsp:Transcript_80864/g.127800  ORF Transcript_80864/g.127800 Transcript_80864/m.127800 type:complete len:242 (-) Transcript_80864:460-1185(-)
MFHHLNICPLVDLDTALAEREDHGLRLSTSFLEVKPATADQLICGRRQRWRHKCNRGHWGSRGWSCLWRVLLGVPGSFPPLQVLHGCGPHLNAFLAQGHFHRFVFYLKVGDVFHQCIATCYSTCSVVGLSHKVLKVVRAQDAVPGLLFVFFLHHQLAFTEHRMPNSRCGCTAHTGTSVATVRAFHKVGSQALCKNLLKGLRPLLELLGVVQKELQGFLLIPHFNAESVVLHREPLNGRKEL